jgi:hypothetical protein
MHRPLTTSRRSRCQDASLLFCHLRKSWQRLSTLFAGQSSVIDCQHRRAPQPDGSTEPICGRCDQVRRLAARPEATPLLLRPAGCVRRRATGSDPRSRRRACPPAASLPRLLLGTPLLMATLTLHRLSGLLLDAFQFLPGNLPFGHLLAGCRELALYGLGALRPPSIRSMIVDCNIHFLGSFF